MSEKGFTYQSPELFREGFKELHHVIPAGFISLPGLHLIVDLAKNPNHRSAEKVVQHLAHFGLDISIHSLVEALVHVAHIVGPAALVATGEGVVVLVASKLIIAIGTLIFNVCRNLVQPSMDVLVQDIDRPTKMLHGGSGCQLEKLPGRQWRLTIEPMTTSNGFEQIMTSDRHTYDNLETMAIWGDSLFTRSRVAELLFENAKPEYLAEWFYVACWLFNSKKNLYAEITECCGTDNTPCKYTPDDLPNHCSRCQIRLIVRFCYKKNCNIWPYVDAWVRSKKTVRNYLSIQALWSQYKLFSEGMFLESHRDRLPCCAVFFSGRPPIGYGFAKS